MCVAVYRTWLLRFWPLVLQCHVVFLCLHEEAAQLWVFYLYCGIYIYLPNDMCFWSGIFRTSLGPAHNFSHVFLFFVVQRRSLGDLKPRAFRERHMGWMMGFSSSVCLEFNDLCSASSLYWMFCQSVTVCCIVAVVLTRRTSPPCLSEITCPIKGK